MSAPLEGQTAVAVIIQAKNEQEVVGLCLESALAQKGFRDRLESGLTDNGACEHTATNSET